MAHEDRGTPPPRASAWQIGGGGGWTGERERRGVGRESSESIFARIVTIRRPVHACKSAETLCMPDNTSTHAIEARLPLHVLKHACTLRNMHAHVGSLVSLTFLRKLE